MPCADTEMMTDSCPLYCAFIPVFHSKLITLKKAVFPESDWNRKIFPSWGSVWSLRSVGLGCHNKILQTREMVSLTYMEMESPRSRFWPMFFLALLPFLARGCLIAYCTLTGTTWLFPSPHPNSHLTFTPTLTGEEERDHFTNYSFINMILQMTK